MFTRPGSQGAGRSNGHCCLGVKELNEPCTELSIHREHLLHIDPGRNQGDRDSCDMRAEVYNDGESRDGDGQGDQGDIAGRQSHQWNSFYFGFIYF